MSLGSLLRTAVQARVPFNEGLEPIIAREGPWIARCDLAGADRLGCAVRQIEIVEESPAPLSNDALTAEVGRICDRVTYLHEPLATIEFDREQGSALLRSREPRPVDCHLEYFELLASRGHSLNLRRYKFDPTSRRRAALDFNLTGDQLQYLVDDIVAASEYARNN